MTTLWISPYPDADPRNVAFSTHYTYAAVALAPSGEWKLTARKETMVKKWKH